MTHEIPTKLPEPPWDLWRKNFDELAKRCDLDLSMENSYVLVDDFHEKLFK